MSSMPHPYGASEPVRECEVAQAPEVPTAVVSKRDFPMYEMNSLMDGTFSHLISALEEVGIQPIGPAFALHHRQPVSTADVEVRSESTRLNSSHVAISYAVFCLKKKINDIS